MHNQSETNTGVTHGRTDGLADQSHHAESPGARENGGGSARFGSNGHASASAFDFWPLAEVVLRHWIWVAVAGIALGGLGLLSGLLLWNKSYTAPAQLIRYESPTAVDVFGYRQISPQTFANMIRSPELLERVGAKAQPPVSASALAANLLVIPERNSELTILSITEKDPQSAITLVNLYADEAVRFTGEMQAKAAGEVNDYLKEQLAKIDADIAAFDRQRQPSTYVPLEPLRPDAPFKAEVRPTKLTERLRGAQEELFDLLMRYTELHPSVQAQRTKIALLQKQLSEKGTPAPSAPALNDQPSPLQSSVVAAKPTEAGAGELPPGEMDVEVFRGKRSALENSRLQLLGRQRAAQAFQDNPSGYFRVFSFATPKEVVTHDNHVKTLFLGLLGGLIGVLGSVAIVLFLELVDKRIKTAADVKRVTRLPVIATLNDLRQLDLVGQKNWAFRTWTALQGRLSPSPHHGLVCGITSSAHGEGRSTWMGLLADAAIQRGFRVLTIATRPSPAAVAAAKETPEEAAGPAAGEKLTTPNGTAVTTNILASPVEVTQRLVGPEPQPRVHIPLPGWVWNLERRKQWHAALNHWRKIDNIVILVELPPACVPEAVLLGESLPNLIWLADSGKADATETRAQLETLRYARCKLVGAVVNRESRSLLKNRLPRWFGSLSVLVALNFAQAQGLETNLAVAVQSAPPVNRDLSFSVWPSVKRAAWQERLTLGPGDTLNFSLFGSPELARPEVSVGPDGRVSFLEAHDIAAVGLTIDELRMKVDEALNQYRHAARTIITPGTFHSKKYFVLGRVAQKGVFTLNRPITIIEAVARAQGFETGFSDRNVVDLADFTRSFLVRQSKRMEVDFEKLFQEGDLSQNVQLEPNDYLYFPSRSFKEVYVLGEVKLPGSLTYAPDLTAVSSIAARGGFTERSWKKRILVARGSLNHPEALVLDAGAVLAARTADLKLQPQDIVYVSSRPWIKVEEVLDTAVQAFVQAAVIVWTGQHVGPFIK